MSLRAFFSCVVLTIAATVLVAPQVAAKTIAALGVDGKTIFIIDVKSATVSRSFKVKLPPADRGLKILAFDIELDGGTIQALSEFLNCYNINPETGKGKFCGGSFEPIGSVGDYYSLEIDPTRDFRRIVTNSGDHNATKIGKNPVERISYASGGGTPEVVGIAHTNPVPDAKTTKLYAIDAARDQLFLQDPPNSGRLTAGKPLGIKVEDPIAFDIVLEKGENKGFVIYQKKLHNLDLKSGKLGNGVSIEGLDSNVKDMTFLPE